MITAQETSSVFVSSLLKRKAPGVSKELCATLDRFGIPVTQIEGTRDIWCRDYMPVWVSETECVQFVFDPQYYQYKKYKDWRTEPLLITPRLGLHPYFCGIVLDGGNVVNNQKTAIVTERIFFDNARWDERLLVETIRQFLQLERVIVVPQVPGDSTGHVDGMIRFVDDDTVLLNDFSQLVDESLVRHIRLCLLNAGLNIVLLPNELHLNRSYDDATGDYINFLEVQNVLVVPKYERSMDVEALKIYRNLFPDRLIEQVNISELTPLGGGLNCISWCIPEKRCR